MFLPDFCEWVLVVDSKVHTCVCSAVLLSYVRRLVSFSSSECVIGCVVLLPLVRLRATTTKREPKRQCRGPEEGRTRFQVSVSVKPLSTLYVDRAMQ